MTLPNLRGDVDPPQLELGQVSNNASLARSNSRSKGINFNTVSPLCVESHHSSKGAPPELKSSITEHLDALQIIQWQDSNGTATAARKSQSYDLNLESNIPSKQLSKLTIDEQLRLLALKEMSLVELKDTIVTLNARLRLSERELQRFRQTIQRNLHREVQVSGAGARIQRRERSDTLHPNGVLRDPRSYSRRSSRTKTAAKRDNTTINSEAGVAKKPINLPLVTRSESSSLWSNLPKPLSLILNLEEIIQSEPNKPTPSQNTHLCCRNGLRSKQELESSSLASLYPGASPLETLKETLAESLPFRDPEEMLHTVSTSLWSFVNEVKQNVLSPSAISSERSPTCDADTHSEFTGSEEEVDLALYST